MRTIDILLREISYGLATHLGSEAEAHRCIFGPDSRSLINSRGHDFEAEVQDFARGLTYTLTYHEGQWVVTGVMGI